MTSLPIKRALVFIAAAAACVAAQAAQARLGVATNIEMQGFFSTTLKRITITRVTPGAPAQQAGLQAGDEVESVDGIPVPGTPGLRLKAVIDAVKPGDHLKLRVKRADGEHLVDIVAGELAPH